MIKIGVMIHCRMFLFVSIVYSGPEQGTKCCMAIWVEESYSLTVSGT